MQESVGKPSETDPIKSQITSKTSRFVMWCDAFVVIVLSDEPGQNQDRGLVDRKLVKAPPPPVIFIAGRPKAALLLWFFVDFRCGALLFMVIHVIYKYKNR